MLLPGIRDDPLSHEFVHHEGEVGDHEDRHHGQRQVGGLLLEAGMVTESFSKPLIGQLQVGTSLLIELSCLLGQHNDNQCSVEYPRPHHQ